MRFAPLAVAIGVAAAVADPAPEPGTSPREGGVEPLTREPGLRDLDDHRSIEAVAKVFRATGGGDSWSTGFAIGDRGQLVTVLPPEAEGAALEVAYGGSGSRRSPAERLAFDPYTGLALLTAPERATASPLETAHRPTVSPGDSVYTVSAAGGERPRCVAGRVAGREKRVGGETLAASVWRIHLDSCDGVAGAPLLDREARVIGVMLLAGGGDGIGYALPVEHLNKLLRDHDKHGAAHAAYLGLGMTMGTSTPEIRSLREGSPAAASGMQPGDVILAIGAREVADYQDVIDACYALTAGEPVEFHLLRGLDDLKLEVTPAIRGR